MGMAKVVLEIGGLECSDGERVNEVDEWVWTVVSSSSGLRLRGVPPASTSCGELFLVG